MAAILSFLPYVILAAAACLAVSLSPALGTAVAGVLIVGAFVFGRKPFWILLLIIGLVPVDSISKFGGMLSLTKLIFPPLLALAIWRRVINRESLWIRQPQRTAVLVFLFAILLSFVMADSREYALLSLKKYASLLMLYWAGLLVISRVRDISHLLYVIILTCAISSAVGLLGIIAGVDTGFAQQWEGVERAGGMSSEDPNTFAMHVLVAFFMAASLLMSLKSVVARGLLAVCILIYSLNLVFSFSRSSLIALAVGMAYFTWSRRREIRWKWVLPMVVVVGICSAPFIPRKYYERIATLENITTSQDGSFKRRIAYHIMGFDLISRSPVWGVGPGNFSYHFKSQVYRYTADTFGEARRLHNMFLSIGSELGLFGLACFLAILVASFRLANGIIRRAREAGMAEHGRNAQALKYALFTFLAGSFFLPAEYSKYLWIILASLSRLDEILEMDIASAPPQPVRMEA